MYRCNVDNVDKAEMYVMKAENVKKFFQLIAIYKYYIYEEIALIISDVKYKILKTFLELYDMLR